MKVYITGIAGLLGASLALVLKEKCEVYGCDLIPADILGCGCKQIDLLNKDALRSHIEEIRPDVLIHTAAMVNVDFCEEHPAQARLLNVGVTDHIAMLCKDFSIKMIYISTDAVFDGKKKGLYTETDKVHPINIYGKTKAEGELKVLGLDNGLVLRTNIYGINIQNKKSFGEWIVSNLENGETLNMFTDIYFSPILTTDFSQIVYLSIENNLRGIYHAGGTGSVSKYEFGIAVKDIFRIGTGCIKPCTSSVMKLVAPRSPNMGMSNQKICQELHISIREPIQSIYDFLRLYREAKTEREGE